MNLLIVVERDTYGEHHGEVTGEGDHHRGQDVNGVVDHSQPQESIFVQYVHPKRGQNELPKIVKSLRGKFLFESAATKLVL